MPLTDEMLAVIEPLKALESDYVFKGQKRHKPLPNMSMLMLLCCMKVEDVTVHGFRSTFRDWASEVANAEVNPKAAKAIDAVFMPVDPAYLECFTAWVDCLRKEQFFGVNDALFPKAKMGLADTGGFQKVGLSRDPFATTTPLNKIIRNAFAMVQLPQYMPHAFRTTLIKMANDRCKTVEEFRAWGLKIWR